MDDLSLILIATVILASLMTAPLGCVGLWNGLAFFGDTLAHASLLGVCLGMLTHTPYALGGVVVAAFLAIIVARESRTPKDAILASVSYASLAISMIVIAKFGKGALDPDSVLFGDILSVRASYLWVIGAIAAVSLTLMAIFFKEIQLVSFDACLARAKKIPVAKVKFSLLIGYGIAIGAGLKVLGALFVPALALLPAVAARNVSTSASRMVVNATIVSVVCGILGVLASLIFDLPTGPAIVAMNSLALVASKFVKR